MLDQNNIRIISRESVFFSSVLSDFEYVKTISLAKNRLSIISTSAPNVGEDHSILTGPADKRKFEVITATIIVLILLMLKSCDEIITIGCLNPGFGSFGSPNEVHQISPLFTTSHPWGVNSLV